MTTFTKLKGKHDVPSSSNAKQFEDDGKDGKYGDGEKAYDGDNDDDDNANESKSEIETDENPAARVDVIRDVRFTGGCQKDHRSKVSSGF